MTKRHTFIHPEIHDFRRPVIIPAAWLDVLVQNKTITKKTRAKALNGEEIDALGYRMIVSKQLPIN